MITTAAFLAQHFKVIGAPGHQGNWLRALDGGHVIVKPPIAGRLRHRQQGLGVERIFITTQAELRGVIPSQPKVVIARHRWVKIAAQAVAIVAGPVAWAFQWAAHQGCTGRLAGVGGGVGQISQRRAR